MKSGLRLAVVLFAAACFSLPVPARAEDAINPASVASEANASRALFGISPLTEDRKLDSIARRKAADMLARGYFSHSTPDGRNSWWWLKQSNYYYYFAGENIAVGFSNAQNLETAWMNSPLHRANIINQRYTRIGVGAVTGTYLGKQTTFIVEYFSTPPQDYTKVLRTLTTNDS